MELKVALELTIKLWDFLAEDADNEKDDHPDYDETYYPLFSSCPLCEYSANSEKTTADCTVCPLGIAGQACDNDDSLFAQWGFQENDSLRTAAAKGIADICRKALSELN